MLQPNPARSAAPAAPVAMVPVGAAPVSEVIASTGLLLMFAAVIGVVLGVAVMGMGSGVLATAIIVASLVSFSASLVCFVVDGRRVDVAEAALPFPSMLRR